MTVHPSITPDRVCAAVEARMTTLDNPGFCLECGEDAMGVEPDARKLQCEMCLAEAVYGADELLISMVI